MLSGNDYLQTIRWIPSMTSDNWHRHFRMTYFELINTDPVVDDEDASDANISTNNNPQSSFNDPVNSANYSQAPLPSGMSTTSDWSSQISLSDPAFLRHSDVLDFLQTWSSLVINEEKTYVRVLSSIHLCFVMLRLSIPVGSTRAIAFDVAYFGVSPAERIRHYNSLLATLASVCPNYDRPGKRLLRRMVLPVEVVERRGVRSYFIHDCWSMVYDAELLPLLIKRRMSKGGFWLLDTISGKYALFAKFYEDNGDKALVQYEINVDLPTKQVKVDVYMDVPKGKFLTRIMIIPNLTLRIKNIP